MPAKCYHYVTISYYFRDFNIVRLINGIKRILAHRPYGLLISTFKLTYIDARPGVLLRRFSKKTSEKPAQYRISTENGTLAI